MKFRAKRTAALRMGATLPDAWRFGDGHTCWWCGRRVHYGREYRNQPLQATREHVVPRSVGGSGARENVVVACFACNTRRSSATDWVPFHALNGIDTAIPPRQWDHLKAIGALPTHVEWKKAPAG